MHRTSATEKANPTSSSSLAVSLGAALWTASLGACSLHKVDTDPPPPVGVPESFGGESGSEEGNDRWWTDFEDPALEGLVEQALGGSFQLRAAWARVTQAEAAIGTARASRWPQVNVTGDINYAERFFPPFGTIDQKTYVLSLPVSYEIDVWNKYGSGVDAAAALARATRDDLEATAMTLAAEVTEAWYDVVARRAYDALLREQLEANQSAEELLEARFARGLAAAIDIYQQRTQTLGTRSQLEANLGQLEVSETQLGILLGESPKSLTLPVSEDLPEVDDLPGVGMPADLLERRPDMRASRERLVAQDHLLAQAIAERLPSLTVSAGLQFAGTTPASLFDNLLKNLGGNITVPLIDGGRRAAKQRAQAGAVEEALAAYGQTLLVAIGEVENALALDRQQQKTLELLEAQRQTSEASLREANGRYLAGVDNYLPVLSANASLQNAERSLVEAQRQRVSLRVQLFRALGGTWTATLERPDPDSEKESS